MCVFLFLFEPRNLHLLLTFLIVKITRVLSCSLSALFISKAFAPAVKTIVTMPSAWTYAIYWEYWCLDEIYSASSSTKCLISRAAAVRNAWEVPELSRNNKRKTFVLLVINSKKRINRNRNYTTTSIDTFYVLVALIWRKIKPASSTISKPNSSMSLKWR